jgi:hypothetical protein
MLNDCKTIAKSFWTENFSTYEFGYMENLEPNGMEWIGMKYIPWNINNMEWNIKKHGME